MLQFKVIPVTPFQQNATLVWCPKTKEAAVIDPGGDLDKITAAIEKHQLKLVKILLTHGHIDHAGGAVDLSAATSAPVIGPHQEDKFWLDSLGDQSRMFQFPDAKAVTPTRWLEDGEVINIGEGKLDVIHCPGHTPGHVVFYSAANKVAQVGDVIFAGSVGRTDFPKSDHQALISSIKNKLLPLGDDVEFIPGHGPNSTFGAEKRSNPFL